MREAMELSTTQQVKALAHPLRIQILTALNEPRTNLQVAQAIEQSPSKTFFHLRELAAAGLVELVDQRPKGGVVEKFYQVAARRFSLNSAMLGSSGSSDVVSAALTSAYEEYHRNGYPGRALVVQETVHLGPGQLTRIQGILDQLRHEIDQAKATEAGVDSQAYAFNIIMHEIR